MYMYVGVWSRCVRMHTKIISKGRQKKRRRIMRRRRETRHITFPYSTISFNFLLSFFLYFFWFVARLTRKWMNTCMHQPSRPETWQESNVTLKRTHARYYYYLVCVRESSFKMCAQYYSIGGFYDSVCAFSAFPLHFKFFFHLSASARSTSSRKM